MKKVDKYICTKLEQFIDAELLMKLKDELVSDPTYLLFEDSGLVHNSLCDLLGKHTIDFSIAANISMCHWYNTIPFRENESYILKLLSMDEYTTHLKDVALYQITKSPLIESDQELNPYVHVPLLYTILYCINILKIENEDLYESKDSLQSKIPNFKFRYNMLFALVDDVTSIVSLLTNAIIDNCFSILRTTIERIFIYYTGKNREDVANDYEYFINTKCEPDWKNKLEIIKPKGRSINKNNFYNYGWIYKLDKNNNFAFTFDEVVENADMSINDKDVFKRLYRICNSSIHANTRMNGKLFESWFVNLSYYLGHITKIILHEYEEIFNFTIKNGDVKLTDELSDLIKETEEILKICVIKSSK